MLIGIVVAFLMWAVVLMGTVVYAVARGRTYINGTFLMVSLVGLLLCGATYGALFSLGFWVIS